MYGRWLRNSFIYLLILVAIVAIVFTLLPGGSSSVERPLTAFIEDAKAQRVESVEVNGTDLTYKLKGDEQTFKSKMEQGDTARQGKHGGLPAHRDQEAQLLEQRPRPPLPVLAYHLHSRHPLLLPAAGPGKQHPGDELRQEPRPDVQRHPSQCDVHGRRRRGRGEGRAGGGRGVP